MALELTAINDIKISISHSSPTESLMFLAVPGEGEEESLQIEVRLSHEDLGDLRYMLVPENQRNTQV